MTITIALVFDVLILFWFGSKVEIAEILAEGLAACLTSLTASHTGDHAADHPTGGRKRSGVTKHRNKAA